MDGSNGKIIELLERIAIAHERTSELIRQAGLEMRAGFAGVNVRFDTDFLGRYLGDHESRIRALEDRVFAKSG